MQVALPTSAWVVVIATAPLGTPIEPLRDIEPVQVYVTVTAFVLVVENVDELPQRTGDELNDAVIVGMITGLTTVSAAPAVAVSPAEFVAVNVHDDVPTMPAVAVPPVDELPVDRVPAPPIGAVQL